MKIKLGQRVWISNRILTTEIHNKLDENKPDLYFQQIKRYLVENCGLILHFCHFKKGLKFKNQFYWRAEITNVEKYMLAKINYGI